MSAATRRLLFFTVFLGFSLAGVAQPGDGGGDPDVPISGIEVLLGLGGALGLRALWQRKKK